MQKTLMFKSTVPIHEPLKLVPVNSITETVGCKSTRTQTITTNCTGFVLDSNETQCYYYDQLASLIRMEIQNTSTYGFGGGNGSYDPVDPDPDPDPDPGHNPELIPFNIYFSTTLPSLHDAISIIEKTIGKKIYGIGFVAYVGDKKYAGPDSPADGQDLSKSRVQFINGNGVRFWPVDVVVTFYFYFVTDSTIIN